MLTRREGQLLGYNATTGNLQVPSSKTVVVNEPGAYVNGTQSTLTNTVTLQQGHGLAAGDFFVNFDAADIESTLREVATVDNATDVTFAGAKLTFVDNDRLVNLGDGETGSASDVKYDGSDKEIWSDPNGESNLDSVNSTLTPNATTGRYGYWYHGEAWELVLDSSNLAESLIIVSDGKTKRTAVSTTYQATPSDDLIALTTIAAPYTVTLPAVATVPVGFTITVIDEVAGAGANTVTVSGSGAENINGANTYDIDENYKTLTVYSNGTAWFIKSQHVT